MSKLKQFYEENKVEIAITISYGVLITLFFIVVTLPPDDLHTILSRLPQ